MKPFVSRDEQELRRRTNRYFGNLPASLPGRLQPIPDSYAAVLTLDGGQVRQREIGFGG